MFKIIAVTNRRLCADDFVLRIQSLAQSGISAVILRERDLPSREYGQLAARILDVCNGARVTCIAHQFISEAKMAGYKNIHLPLAVLEKNPDAINMFAAVGVSVHSAEEASRAVSLGASYLIAGHIFDTKSKEGRLPRGLAFLSGLCRQFSLPVYAIGGITENNIAKVQAAGAAGACLMSEFMTKMDVAERLWRAVTN